MPEDRNYALTQAVTDHYIATGKGIDVDALASGLGWPLAQVTATIEHNCNYIDSCAANKRWRAVNGYPTEVVEWEPTKAHLRDLIRANPVIIPS